MDNLCRLLKPDNDKVKEAAFRNYYLKDDISQTRKVTLLLSIPFLAFIVNDYMFFGFSLTFDFLLVVRASLLFIIGFSWYKMGSVSSYQTWDKIMFWSIMAAIICGGLINASRSDIFLMHSIFTLVVVFILYLTIPLRFDSQIILSSFMSIGEASIILIFANSAQPAIVYTLLISLLAANIIAAAASWEIHSRRRGYFEELSQRKSLQDSLEQQVNERTKELVEAQSRLVRNERLAAIGELAGMIGHDLRNPLAGIKNAVYVVRKKQSGLGEVGLSMLDTIDQAVEHADSIIADLLDYGREINLQMEEQSSKALIDYSILSLKIPSNIAIKQNIQNTLLRVDGNKIQRVFANLIKNAFDAMPKGGELAISSIQKENTVDFIFRDTGIGMSKEVAAKIFTPLFTTKAQGMGLGLVICKRFVEAHKGKLSVESEQNKGTAFIVSLPIAQKC
jgi:signal transduction histidine kinase